MGPAGDADRDDNIDPCLGVVRKTRLNDAERDDTVADSPPRLF